jgi:hypothetical protein
MSMRDDLKTDPRKYVEGMKSPIGIYLRREVFEKEAKNDLALKSKLYERTIVDQSTDGSWNQ